MVGTGRGRLRERGGFFVLVGGGAASLRGGEGVGLTCLSHSVGQVRRCVRKL